MMVLNRIQEQLEALYQIDLGHSVEDYLIDKPPVEKPAAIRSRWAKEALYIKQEGKEIALALYIDPALIAKLKQENPFLSLSRHNLEAFLMAVEGISHFLYFLKSAALDQKITQLELEIQAEIDKYFLAALLYYRHTKRIPRFLFGFLFENFQLPKDLNREEKSRYTQANRFATRFCSHLETECLRRGRWRTALERLRDFYHLNHWDKIRRLTP